VFHPVFPGADTTAVQPVGPRQPLPLAIKDLSVEQVAFSFEERGRDRTVKLYDSALKGSGMGDEWHGTIQGWLSLMTHGQPKPLAGEVKLDGNLAQGILNLEGLGWKTPAGNLDAKGQWTLSTGEVTARAQGDASLDT